MIVERGGAGKEGREEGESLWEREEGEQREREKERKREREKEGKRERGKEAKVKEVTK